MGLAASRNHGTTSYGRIEMLFANAAIAAFAPFGKVTEDDPPHEVMA